MILRKNVKNDHAFLVRRGWFMRILLTSKVRDAFVFLITQHIRRKIKKSHKSDIGFTE